MSKAKSQMGKAAVLLSMVGALSLVSAASMPLLLSLSLAQPALAAPSAWLDNENTFLERGKRDYNSGQFDQALKDFCECIRLNPRRTEALYWRSMVYSALHDNDRAISDLDQAIRVDPGNALVFLNRGLIYSNQGKHEAAVSDFDQALKLDGGLSEARTNREFCLKELEKAKGAPQKAAEPAQQTAANAGTTTVALAGGNTTSGIGTGGNLTTSSGYTPYTGKPSNKLAALQKEQREAESRLSKQRLEADKLETEKARLEERNAELALKEKEAEIRLETARLKKEEAEAARLAKSTKVVQPAIETIPAKKRGKVTGESGKVELSTAGRQEADNDALEIVNRPVRDKWALVVGISDFQDKKLNLHYPAKDAKDFANFLVSDGNFAKDHVKLLINEEATRNNILSKLGDDWLPHVANPDDLVLIYISSHGSPSEMDTNGINYLLAYDTNVDHLFATGLPMQELTGTIKNRVHSDRVVVVLDACHSGAAETGAKGMVRTRNVDAEAIAQGSGQLVISSSSTDQVSWESKKYENSVFTRCLIESLKKSGNATTLGEAFQAMKDQVQAQVLSERGVLQTPVLKSKWKGGDLRISAPAAAPRVGG